MAQRRRGRGRPAGTGYFGRNPKVGHAVELLLARQAYAAPRILEMLETQFGDPPSIQQLRRFIREVEDKNAAVLASMRDPDLYKSKYRLALGRADGGVDSVHQVWELDTTKADVMTTGGRVAVLGLIDRYSRLAHFLIAPSESGLSVRRLLISAIKAWGVIPDAVATDNGSGYVNKSVKSALDLLEIEQIICPPGSPEKKPFVERLFGTFMRERASILPGFTGHSVADAQRLRGRAKKLTGRAAIEAEITPAELQAILSAWTDGTYHHRRHSSIRMTPHAKASASARMPRKAPDPDTLGLALTDLIGARRVGKRGVEYRSGRYWHPELAAFLGRDVTVRRDEDDLGELMIFDDQGQFVCKAVHHTRAGLSEQAFAEAARRHVSTYRNQEAARIRSAARDFSIEDAVTEIRRREIERAENITCFPQRTRDHQPAFVADQANTDPVSVPDLETLKQEVAARTGGTAAGTSVATRVAETDRLIAAAERGQIVDETELARARLYATGSEYRAEKMVAAHFAQRPETNADTKTRRKESA